MGLVTRRSQQLDKLFDQFAVDPKIKPLKKKPADEKTDKKEKEDKKKQVGNRQTTSTKATPDVQFDVHQESLYFLCGFAN